MALVDTSQLDKLASDIAHAPKTVGDLVGAVIKRGAQNIKKDAQARITGQIRGIYLPHFARAITYDMTGSGAGTVAEIGPETGRMQGGMGAAIEFGSSRHGPLPYLFPSLDAEVPKTTEELAKIMVKFIR